MRQFFIAVSVLVKIFISLIGLYVGIDNYLDRTTSFKEKAVGLVFMSLCVYPNSLVTKSVWITSGFYLLMVAVIAHVVVKDGLEAFIAFPAYLFYLSPLISMWIHQASSRIKEDGKTQV